MKKQQQQLIESILMYIHNAYNLDHW